MILLAGVWSGGPAPAGSDSWGHLYRAEYLADQIRQDGWPAYLRTAWMPGWYLGDPFRTYYPPLAVLVLSPLVYFFGDSFLAVRIFNSVLLVALAGATYGCLLTLSAPWPACLGTLLSLAAPFQIRTIFLEGNFNRSLSLLALPPIAALTEILISTRGRRAPAAAALTACWAFAILAHPQQALIYAVGFGIYAVGRLFFDPDLPLKRAGLWLVTVAAGALLTAAWTLPAYSGGELSNVPYQPADIAEIYSTRLDYFVPALDMTRGKVLFGLGAILLALLATAARPEPRRSAYFLAGVLALWFSLGSRGVVYTLLPLNQQLIPERFVNFAAFAFAVAAAGLLPLGRTARPARVFIIAGLLAVDFLPSAGAASGREVPESIAATRQSLARHASQVGRTALFTYPEPGSANVYYAAQSTPTIFGWTLQNTPHHLAIRRVLGAPTWGPEYLAHLLRLWDVQWAVVQGPPRQADPAREALDRAGFAIEESREYEIWARAGPAGPVQALPENRMLLLGDRLPPMLAVFPFAEEAEETHLSRLEPADLASYPVVGLYQFESSQAALGGDAARLSEYVAAGGTVVLDLSGMEDLVGRTLNFLDVDVLRVSFSEAMPLRWSGDFAGLPEQLPIAEISPEGWSGAAYTGLDTVLAEVLYQGTWWPVLGYKDLGEGRIWFVGLNLLYYAQLSGETGMADRIKEASLEGVDVFRDLEFPAVAVDGWDATGTRLSFSVDAGEAAREVVVSYTYSPRWRAEVDGRPSTFRSYEHLLALSLPPGTHEVVFRYSPYGTMWPVLGLLVSFLAALVVGGALWIEEARYVSPEERTAPAAPAAPEYAPCANCGFRLAEVGPPTPITYPFQVVHCPICGMRMDNEGFQAGEALDESGKERALAAWLRRHDYDPEIVHQKWGFSAKEFFTTVPLPADSGGPQTGEGS